MPFPNFHAARIRNPEEFTQIKVLKTLPNGIMIYGGRLKSDPRGSSKEQTFRFPKEKFTTAEAKVWLKEHNKKSILFEPAKEEKDCGTKKRKEDSDENEYQRFDYFDFIQDLIEPFKPTSEGYLTGKAIITNVGVFTYLNNDGTLRRELRLPEEVFNSESIDTLKSKPVTNNHPPEIITIDNIKNHQVGFTGNKIDTSPFHISTNITITDQQTIDDIKSGKRGLSAGYKVNLDFTPGVWMGSEYDCIQRKIRYNHVAIVNRGRAGDDAKIRMDSKTAICAGYNNESKEDKEVPDNPILKTIRIDEVEYKAEPEVIQKYIDFKKDSEELKVLKSSYTILEKERNDLKTTLSKTEAERDTALSENKKLKEDQADESKIKKLVTERINIISAASRLKIDVKDTDSNSDIQKACILKKFPDAKLDGKDEVYINARFDTITDLLSQESDAKKRESIQTIKNNFILDDSLILDEEQARQNMINRIYHESRGLTVPDGINQ